MIRLLRWLMEIRRKIFRILRKRAFLVRLLVTTLLAAFVPLTVMALHLISRESDHVRESAQAQLQSVTNAAAAHFDDYIDSINRINVKMLMAAPLHESNICTSVASEIEALEAIDYYSNAIPFVKDYALYIRSVGVAYSRFGKLMTNGLCKNVLCVDEATLNRLLDEYSAEAGFVPWGTMDNSMLYIAPLRAGSVKGTNRYSIYIISPITLTENYSLILPDGYSIVSISDPDGNTVYRSASMSGVDFSDPDCPWLLCSSVGRHSYTIEICADKSAFQQNVETLTSNAQLLSLMNIVLCAILILMVVILNYRPLALVVSRIRDEDADESATELDSILASYRQLVDAQGKLTWQLYEKTLLIVDRVMENLLSGRRVQPDDMRLLKLNMPFYRVVCAPLDRIRDSAAIIEHNEPGAPVYAIEMYEDDRMAFICGSADDSPAALRNLTELLRRLLGSDEIPLGFSSAYDSPDRLFMAYLEAGKSLTADNESPDHLPAELSGGQMYIMDEKPEDVESLAYAIKTGDPEMVAFADRAFDAIRSGIDSPSLCRYACYQLIDLYRRLGSAVGLELDMEALAQVLQQGDVDEIAGCFRAILTAACESRKNELSKAADTTYSNLIRYINDHFTDPMFSMNDVADHLGVSIYTASRMLKTMTGIKFRKHLNDMRVEYARDLLLTTDLPVKEVSARAGFTSPTYFNSVFKESENTTPSNFRKQHREV